MSLFPLKTSVGHELPVRRVPGMAVDLQAAREERAIFCFLNCVLLCCCFSFHLNRINTLLSLFISQR